MRRTLHVLTVAVAVLAVSLAAAPPAAASFHLMQIEQVAGGVCGDRSAQAIQLRMRGAGQNLVAGTLLVARNAAGGSPVTLITFPSNVAGAGAGARILASTAGFTAASGPAPDFTLTTPIPLGYLAAGKLTFEDSVGNVLWGLAWGGASYTGTNTGTIDNDADGNFNPPFAGALPATDDVALRFTGTAGAMSTNNAADYALSASPATFTNNAGASGAVATCVFYDGFESGDTTAWTNALP
jgi:hypothetical protein